MLTRHGATSPHSGTTAQATSPPEGMGAKRSPFFRSSVRVDFASAAAAGLFLNATYFVLTRVSILSRSEHYAFNKFATLALLTTGCYLIAALILHKLRPEAHTRIVPDWAIVASLGSLLIVLGAGGYNFYRKQAAWGDVAAVVDSASRFLSDKYMDGVGALLFLSLYTAPIIALVHRVGRRLGRSGVSEPPPRGSATL